MTLFLNLGLALIASGQVALPEVDGPAIGYASPSQALEALQADPAVSETRQGGWRIFSDRAHNSIWSFPPKDHPAYPSAVKREFVERDGGVYVQMGVQCGASKIVCDQLVRDFQLLNKQMSDAFHANQTGQSK